MTSRVPGRNRKGAVRAKAEDASAKLRQSAMLREPIRLVLEQLENRVLLSGGSVTLTNGLLDIEGTRRADIITVERNASDHTQLDVSLNGVVTSFAYAAVNQINVNAGAGNDQVVLENNGISMTTPSRLVGGSGDDWLVGADGPDTILGGAGRDRIMGGAGTDWIDGGGGKDLINTGKGKDYVAPHSDQTVDTGGAALSLFDKHHRYVKSDPLVSSVTPIVSATGTAAAFGGYTPTQISHAYGLDQLSAPSLEFPVYTNTGSGQAIAIVAPRALGLFGVGNDLQLFDALFGLPNPIVKVVTAPNQTGPIDPAGAVETALDVEWAHAMAPGAQIILVQVDSVNGGFFGSDLVSGVSEAINQLQSTGGGVVNMSFGTVTEDALLAQQFDQQFSSSGAKNISFIASSGDDAGAQSSPAMSPYVTSVGGTDLILNTTGARFDETAWLYGGGGLSTIYNRPAFQAGITVNGKAQKDRRLGPDLSLIAEGRGGAVQIEFGKVILTVSGTSVSAPILSGMIADANELRNTLRETELGSDLNNQLYKAWHQSPTTNFFDITAGNNTHQAYPGFDLATGMGSPNAANLLPALAGVVITNQKLVLNGDQIAPLTAPITGIDIAPVHGFGTATIGPTTVTLTFTGNIAQTLVGQVTVSLSLDGSFSGTTTITITTTSSTGVVTTQVYDVLITGRVTRKKGRAHLSGTVQTIDPATGQVAQGRTIPIFEATFSA